MNAYSGPKDLSKPTPDLSKPLQQPGNDFELNLAKVDDLERDLANLLYIRGLSNSLKEQCLNLCTRYGARDVMHPVLMEAYANITQVPETLKNSTHLVETKVKFECQFIL